MGFESFNFSRKELPPKLPSANIEKDRADLKGKESLPDLPSMESFTSATGEEVLNFFENYEEGFVTLPSSMNPLFEKAALENGIEITSTITPKEILEKLKQKRDSNMFAASRAVLEQIQGEKSVEIKEKIKDTFAENIINDNSKNSVLEGEIIGEEKIPKKIKEINP